MVQTNFLSPYQIDEQKFKFIDLPQFLLNCALDVGFVLVGLFIWRYILWVPTNKLTIPIAKNRLARPYRDEVYNIGPNYSFITLLKHIKALVKNLSTMTDNVIILRCGFEYFTYLYFLRRLCLLMSILIITDLCFWLPYMLIIADFSQLSLITMQSTNNNQFRAFYSIWIAFITLYGIHDMKTYLRGKFLYHNYRQVKQANRQQCHQKHLLNNLKAKTLHMQFLDGHFIDQASIKAQMQQYLVEDMQQQDRIIAVQAIPAFSDLLQCQYQLKITQIVKQYGVNNLRWIWKFFKQQTDETIQQQNQKLMKQMQNKIQQAYNSRTIRSCLIVVSHLSTAQKLCNQFEIGKAICNVCPDFGYASQQATWKVADSKMIVRWAQQPKDLIWINMGQHQTQLFNFILFNGVCLLLLVVSFFFIAITSTKQYIQMPRVIGPAILLIVNSTLRFLIAKMVEWQKKTLKSEWQIKQFKLTIIYLLINIILGSIVRDTLNLLGLLQTGWGWIQLFSLIYKKADGLFYYILILNQAAVSCFMTLVKPGEQFLDCFQSGLWYQKVSRVKRKAMYGRNDAFNIGYAYSLAFLILSVVIIYSVSCPLIHIFGLIYFGVRLYLDTYTISVFHEEQLCSNLRLIDKVSQTISSMIAAWIFLTATSMIFDANYSNAIILYLFCGLIIYYAAISSQGSSLRDYRSDQIIRNTDTRQVIQQWKMQYMHPFDTTRSSYLFSSNYNSRIGVRQSKKR